MIRGIKKNLTTHYLLRSTKRGFTLAELFMVMAIFTIISGIVLFNFKGFQNSISLGNLADDIAISIRKAQVYAVGSKGVQIQGYTGVQFPGYGIRFSSVSSSASSGANEKAFVFFADIPAGPFLPGDNMYMNSTSTCDPSNISMGNECLDVIKINSGDKISEICIDGTCNGFGMASDDTIDIVFKRPEPDAYFCVTSSMGSPSCSFSTPSNVGLKVMSPKGDTKMITVYNTGQISVQ